MGQCTALTIKLECAINALSRGQLIPALNQLNAFINQINDFIADGILSEEEGHSLIGAVQFVIDLLVEFGIDAFGGNVMISQTIPDEYGIFNVYPNPFNSSTTISFALPEGMWTKLTVCDLSGRKVETLIDGFKEPGVNSVVLTSDNLATGMYIVRLAVGEKLLTQKVLLVR